MSESFVGVVWYNNSIDNLIKNQAQLLLQMMSIQGIDEQETTQD